MEQVVEWLCEYRASPSLERRFELAEALVETILPRVEQYISARCPADAVEEVLQESLAAISCNLHTLEGTIGNQFWGWCYGITRRKVADLLQERARHPLVLLAPEELWGAVEASAVAQPPSPEERADLNSTLELLRRTEPQCYEYLVRRYILDFTLVEMAQAEGLNPDTVRMRINRCLAAARARLRKR